MNARRTNHIFWKPLTWGSQKWLWFYSSKYSHFLKNFHKILADDGEGGILFEPGLQGWESAKLTTRPWEYYLYLMQKSLDLYLVNLDMALLVRAISMSFFKFLIWRAFRIYGRFFWHSIFHKIRLGRTVKKKVGY